MVVPFPIVNSQIYLIVVLVQLPNMLKGTCALSISCAAMRALLHQCMAFSQRWLKFRFWTRLIFAKVVSWRMLSGNTQQIFHEHIFAFICKQCKYNCTKLVISRSTCLYIVERSTFYFLCSSESIDAWVHCTHSKMTKVSFLGYINFLNGCQLKYTFWTQICFDLQTLQAYLH